MQTKPRILLVEDDHAIADALLLRLKASGFDVTPAPDGQSAIDVAPHVAPDVLLVDVNLPLKDGFEVAEAIRGSCGMTPVVLITAMRSERVREQAEAMPLTWFVEKPFTTPFLVQRLREAVNAR